MNKFVLCDDCLRLSPPHPMLHLTFRVPRQWLPWRENQPKVLVDYRATGVHPSNYTVLHGNTSHSRKVACPDAARHHYFVLDGEHKQPCLCEPDSLYLNCMQLRRHHYSVRPCA
mmetsp:Transcript_8090/g.25278  ORF Transcript_8090/g.25278 Transcript_8090/m.25278 type:complete len:114 (-) Transcript_8090:121-462(-)